MLSLAPPAIIIPAATLAPALRARRSAGERSGRAGVAGVLRMKWLTILFTLFIILIIVLADTGNLGILSTINRIPGADKVGHFILYGILILLIDLTLFRSLPLQSRTWVAVTSALILALLIGIEEFSQQYFADRTFSLMDLSASYLGLICFSWLAIKTKQ